MIVTRDKSIIMPILNEVIETMNHGEPYPEGFTDKENKLFLYEDGCLFPTTIRDDLMLANIHAAVPKERRGKAAVKAAKICIKWLQDQDYTVISTICNNRPEVRLFARMCGLQYIKDHQDLRIYKAS